MKMKCPKCQFDNYKIAKFCEQCGTCLARKCPYCGAEVSPTARFCSECGQSLIIPSKQEAAIHAIIYGLVQGVNFRIFVLRHARSLSLTGYVKNLSGKQAVEVVAEGERKKLKQLLRQLKAGPHMARVKRVVVNWSDHRGKYDRFRIES